MSVTQPNIDWTGLKNQMTHLHLLPKLDVQLFHSGF